MKHCLLVFFFRFNGSSVQMAFQFFWLSIKLKASMSAQHSLHSLFPGTKHYLLSGTQGSMEEPGAFGLRSSGKENISFQYSCVRKPSGREPFMYCPCVEYRKMLTDLQDGGKDSGIDLHWSWDSCVGEFILVSTGNTCQNRFVQNNIGEKLQFSYCEGLYYLWY